MAACEKMPASEAAQTDQADDLPGDAKAKMEPPGLAPKAAAKPKAQDGQHGLPEDVAHAWQTMQAQAWHAMQTMQVVRTVQALQAMGMLGGGCLHQQPTTMPAPTQLPTANPQQNVGPAPVMPTEAAMPPEVAPAGGVTPTETPMPSKLPSMVDPGVSDGPTALDHLVNKALESQHGEHGEEEEMTGPECVKAIGQKLGLEKDDDGDAAPDGQGITWWPPVPPPPFPPPGNCA